MAKFPDWLASLGAQRRDLPRIDRGLPYTHSIRYPGNVTTWGLSGSIKSTPDTPTELAVFSISTPAFDAGTNLTTWVASLTASQTLGLPADNDANGVEPQLYDFIISQPAGANPRRLMGGLIEVSGFITELS